MTEEINKNWKTTFGAIWAGQAFSMLGSTLVQFALVWWFNSENGQRHHSGYSFDGRVITAGLSGTVCRRHCGSDQQKMGPDFV